MSDNVVSFRVPEPEDLIWRCECGCATHYVHADGRVECAQCQNIASGAIGEWRKNLPGEPRGPVEPLSEGDTKVTDWGSAENAIRRVLKRADPDNMIFLTVAHRDGHLSVWGQDLETDEQQAWLRRKLDEVARLLGPSK